MKILVVGSGGREHALCWAIAKSPKCDELFCAPGNAGIAEVAQCVAVEAEDVSGIVKFATANKIDFVVVGPEAPLVAGMVDELDAAGITAFGTNAKAAELEGSKGFMKDLCGKFGIPTAEYDRFDEPDAAKEYIRIKGAPIVVKADGLAAGKGVILCHNVNVAYAAIDHMMSERAFGEAGNEVVIEEFLKGEEASFFALVDGETALPLASAQDHKAVHDGDTGPNTGGMGAYSPAPVITDVMVETIMETIVNPTIKGMATEGRPFKGILFVGLMIENDEPKVLEYNVRFGDPECQALMMRMKSDVVEALWAAATGTLKDITLEWRDEAAMTVVMATNGYPGHYEKGSEIKNLAQANAIDDVTVFHAGTSNGKGKAGAKKYFANGGRVLGVTALGKTVAAAQKRAYQGIDTIDWPQGFNRTDIGWRAIKRK